MKEVIIIVGFCLAFVAALLALVFSIGYPIDKYSCSQKAKNLGLEHKYSFFAGCYVRNTNGQYVNTDNYQSVNLEKK